MVLNNLAFGFPNRHIANNFCVGQNLVWKYTFIVMEDLAIPKKSYFHFITVPQGENLISITTHFKKIDCVRKICEAIDGNNIRLVEKPPLNLISYRLLEPT